MATAAAPWCVWMKDRQSNARADVVVNEIEWLDRLRAKLAPHVDDAVTTLATLAKTASRESVRLKASAKLLGLYAQTIADTAKLREAGRPSGADDDDNVRVLVIDKAQLPQAMALLASQHQASRKQQLDVS